MLNVQGSDIFLYGLIGPSELGYISAMDFIDAVSMFEGKDINLRIMSAGGSVDQGIAIYNAIKRRRGKTTIYVDSVAASIASVIAMAGDSVVMSEGSKLMIHKPWTIAAANADGMRKMADLLDKYEEGLVDIYVNRSGMDREKVLEMMAEETWMTAKESVEFGFADSIEGSVKEEPQVPRNVFQNVPNDVKEVEIKSTKRLDQVKLALRLRELMAFNPPSI
jgi:ATP-dependent Clp protease protease subunit